MTDFINRVGRVHLALLAVVLAAFAFVATTPDLARADDDTGKTEPAPEKEPGGEEAPALEEEAPELPWVTDWAAAKAQAAKEGKDLLINFTGSDWCVYCIRLDKEVFAQADFIAKAPDEFVFVYFDTPRKPEAQAKVDDPELVKQLFNEYGCQGYPSVLVTFADGTPYGRTGYQAGGPEAYLKNLSEIKAGSKHVKALLAEGGRNDIEVVKNALDVLQKQNLLGHKAYEWVLPHVEKLAAEKDPDGTHGLAKLVEAEKERRAIAAEEAEFKQFLSKFQGSAPDWNEVADYLLGMKHGKSNLYVRVAMPTIQQLMQIGELERAGKLIDRLGELPLFSEHPRAKADLQAMRDKHAEAVKAAAEPEEDDADEPDEGEDEIK